MGKQAALSAAYRRAKYLLSTLPFFVSESVSDRSERGSIIVTTNLPFSQWTELFENTAMVVALVDRLTFQSYVLDMNDAFLAKDVYFNRNPTGVQIAVLGGCIFGRGCKYF